MYPEAGIKKKEGTWSWAVGVGPFPFPPERLDLLKFLTEHHQVTKGSNRGIYSGHFTLKHCHLFKTARMTWHRAGFTLITF